MLRMLILHDKVGRNTYKMFEYHNENISLLHKEIVSSSFSLDMIHKPYNFTNFVEVHM